MAALLPRLKVAFARPGLSIFEQLRAEEALYRTSKAGTNWCIVNWCEQDPTVVLGLSGKPHLLVNEPLALEDKVPLIRRYTGGGTVIVGNGTLFVTLVMDASSLPHVVPFPRPIMDWSEGLYKRIFGELGLPVTLRENDYVIGERKIGGNAQAISGNRWVHHTSFLWNLDMSLMRYLQQPAKAPEYRQGREHTDFVCNIMDELTVKDGETVDDAQKQFQRALSVGLQHEFEVETVEWTEVEAHQVNEHRQATVWVQEH